MEKLPKWCVTDTRPALYDTESATVIEMTAKVYGAMNELIDDYNAFVDRINEEIEAFETSSEKNYELFTVSMRQEFQDFIDTIELKVKAQDKAIADKFSVQDTTIANSIKAQDAIIADAVSYLKTELHATITALIVEMRENGELTQDILNAFNELTVRVDNLTGVENSKRFVNTNMYGQGDTACILNVNNTDRIASILGGKSSDKVLASYDDRDIVAIYTDLIAPVGLQFESETFTVNSVTAPEGVDLSGLLEGMIVDCYNSDYLTPTNKYSGFISSVDGQTIYVQNWYKSKDTTEGQTPTSDYKYIVVNGATKTWLYNGNTCLQENSVAKFAVIGEYGLFNNKSATDPNASVDGIDIVNFTGKTRYGVQVRKQNDGEIENAFIANKATKGFVATNANHAFNADNTDYNGFVALNTMGSSFCAGNSHDDYRYKRDGIGRLAISQRLMQTITASRTLGVGYDTHLIAGDDTVITLPAPTATLTGRVFELFCIGTVTFNYENGFHFPVTEESAGGYGQSYKSEKKQLLHLICDGANWYLMK